MKKYELLNQLQQQLNNMENEKKDARKIVEELCAEWNWTLDEAIENIQQITNIIINKGKIVEVPVVKEVVKYETKEVMVDNTDTATIEMLRETIRRMNHTMNDMNKQHDEEIKELKEELSGKELLLNEFRDNMDNKIKTMNEQKNEIADLKATIKRLNAKIMILEAEDEVFEEEKEEETVVTDNKGGDAVSLFNIPEEYKDHPEIKAIVEKKTEEYNNAKGFGTGRFQFTAEQEREEIIKQTNKAILNCIEEYELINKYELDIQEIRNKKNNTIVAVEGFITLAGNKHLFKYGATHKRPFIFGCWNEKLVQEAKEILDKATNMIKDETEERHVSDVHYDFEKGIAVFQENDGTFKACVRYGQRNSGGAMCYTWDSKQYALPCGETLNKVIKRYEREGEIKVATAMKEGRNNGQFKLAKEFIAYCETIDKCNLFAKEKKQATNDEGQEETNEVVVNTKDVASNVTKEAVLNVAEEVDELDI